jgi:uncharacterized OsmC-like protein
MTTPDAPLSFTVTARSTRGDPAGVVTTSDGQRTHFDATAERDPALPSPADLLTAAFAACTLKNVARFASMLGFTYDSAQIEVTAERADEPPRIAHVNWVLTIHTSDPPERLRLLQANIERHGTIYNTVAAAATIAGEVVVRPVSG